MTLANVPRYDGDRISRVGEHAVVVGGSMAGLLAARVLADGFDAVTVVDRDPLPDEPVARRGVPQANHVHVMLEAGRATLEDLFPGYGEELLSAGGVMIDAASDLYHYEQGDFLADGPKRLPMYCATRPLFEVIVRRRVADLDGVTVRAGCQFIDYLADDSATTVQGVVVRDDGERTEVAADLVVDATGRTSRTPTWLDERGYAPPAVDEVYVDVAYSTAVVRRPADDRRGYLVPPSPPRTRGGGAIPVEGDRWLVTMFGVHGEEPPTDAEGFSEYAASLPVPELEQILDARPWVSGEIDHYPFPSNLRRRYWDLDRFPDGLVVVGDAIASFNPLYGQGMSVAALDAVLLHHALATGGREGLGPRFFDRVKDIIDVVWTMTVGADFEFPQTDGPRPLGTGLFNRYVSRLVRRAHSDGELTDAFYRVLRLERTPTSLFHPGVVWRVLVPTNRA